MCLRETETRLLQRPRLAPVLTTTVAQTSRWHSCAMFVAIKMNKLQQFGGAEPSRHTAIGLLLDKLLNVTGTKVSCVFATTSLVLLYICPYELQCFAASAVRSRSLSMMDWVSKHLRRRCCHVVQAKIFFEDLRVFVDSFHLDKMFDLSLKAMQASNPLCGHV